MYRNYIHSFLYCLLITLFIPSTLQASPAMPSQQFTLNQAIQLALQNNQTILQSNLNMDLSTARYEEAQRAFAPQLIFAESIGRQYAESYETKAYNFNATKWQKITTNEMLQNTYSSKFSLQVPLYSGHRLEANREQAAQNAKQTTALSTKTRQNLILDTTTAYFSLLQSNNSLNLAEEAKAQMQAHLNNTMINFENGIVPRADILRAEMELASAEQTLSKAKNSVQLSQTALCNLMGIDLHTNIEAAALSETVYPLQELSTYITLAKQFRPELLAAHAQTNSAQAALTAAKSGHLPSLNLNSAYEWKGNAYPPGDSSWNVLLTATWNVFDGGITTSKIVQAQKALEISQSQERQWLDTIELEVTQAYFSILDAANRLTTARKATLKADEDFRIAQLRYQGGLSSSVELLDSHVAFLTAKNNFIQSQYDYHTNYARLLKASGRIEATYGEDVK